MWFPGHETVSIGHRVRVNAALVTDISVGFRRHFGAYPDGHQLGVSLQISMKLGGKLLQISCMRKIAVT